MTAPQIILLPTDFTGRCDRARERAIQLARLWDAELVLLHVLSDDPADTHDRAEARARAEERLHAEVQGQDVRFRTLVAWGGVANAILESCADLSVDLIVTGLSHREDLGDYIVGTTVERVARHGCVPLLIVKARADGDYKHLMAATDFSGCSRTALLSAVALWPEAEVSLLHAYHVRLEGLRGREGPAASQQAEIAWELDSFLADTALPDDVRARLEVNVDYGDVCQVARDHVQTYGADLAVVGTHGRSALVAAMLGDTARALLKGLECDVLLVPGARA